MSKFRTLPLGIDIGSSRIRVALAESNSTGEVRLRAVAARDVTEDVRTDVRLFAALLDETLSELGARHRTCVTALGSPHATLRVVAFPKMSWHERLRAARFEASRLANVTGDGVSIVRVHRAKPKDNTFAIGVTSQPVLGERIALMGQARLKIIAIDHDSLALRRAIPFSDAILDIGAERSTLHHYASGTPFSTSFATGGSDVTRGIARELSIDEASAERRKRILGSAGAGIANRNALVAELAAGVERARARAPITHIALVGNGARLPGLASELEATIKATTELLVPPLLQTDAYPEDVIRSAAPDWMLAAALATWSIAA